MGRVNFLECSFMFQKPRVPRWPTLLQPQSTVHPSRVSGLPGLGTSPLVQAPNVILHRTPTPIQPKPAGVLPPKLYQLTPKPFAPAGATLTIQGEAGGLPQPPKAPQNLTFMAAGKAGQNVVLSGFPAPALQANVFKPPPATTTGAAPPQPPGTLSKPMSVHLLNQGSSIVIPAQHMLPGQAAAAWCWSGERLRGDTPHPRSGAVAVMKSLSRVRLFATSWTAAYQAPLSMGFSRS